jgi:hypothetical protein
MTQGSFAEVFAGFGRILSDTLLVISAEAVKSRNNLLRDNG